MKSEEFEIIASRLQGFGEYLYFHVMGEPLLHPELNCLLNIADKMGYKVNITTNGTLLQNSSETLLDSGALRQINISLHSYEANNIDMSLEKYLKNIIDFTRKAQQDSDIIIAYRLWNSDGADKNNERIVNYIQKGFNLDFDLKEELSLKKRIKLGDKLYLNCANKFDWPDMDAETKEGRAFCYGLRDQIGVLSDGTVIPCCLDNEGTIALGNLFEETLENILEGTKAKNIYRGFSEGRAVEELCKRCGYRSRF
jgi:Predicted Fe-S oxidoreductases